MLSSGQVPSGDEWDAALLPGNIVKQGERITVSTAASGAQGVLRVDSIPVTAGRAYLIMTNTLLMIASVANDAGSARLYYVTGGGLATPTDTLLTGYNSRPNLSTSANTNGTPALIGRYTAVADTTLSVLLATQRLSGTGLISLNSAFGGIQLMIFDAGVDPGDTGTDI